MLAGQRLPSLHRAMQELEHLNLALNNVTRVQNLQRCESLRRLDLTANFVDLAGLLSLRRQAGQRSQGQPPWEQRTCEMDHPRSSVPAGCTMMPTCCLTG